MDSPVVPPNDVVEMAARLARPTPMRRGSVSERFMKCGRPNCRCHEDPKARHGPYVTVARGRGTDPLAVPYGRAGRARAPAGRGGPAVSQDRRGILAGLRAMGRCRTRSHGGCLAGGGQRGLKEAFEAEVTAEIEALVGKGATDGLDFEAIETAARRRALQVAARAVERRLNADRSDHMGRACSVPAGRMPATVADLPRHSRPCWAR